MAITRYKGYPFWFWWREVYGRWKVSIFTCLTRLAPKSINKLIKLINKHLAGGTAHVKVKTETKTHIHRVGMFVLRHTDTFQWHGMQSWLLIWSELFIASSRGFYPTALACIFFHFLRADLAADQVPDSCRKTRFDWIKIAAQNLPFLLLFSVNFFAIFCIWLSVEKIAARMYVCKVCMYVCTIIVAFLWAFVRLSMAEYRKYFLIDINIFFLLLLFCSVRTFGRFASQLSFQLDIWQKKKY